MGKKFMSNIKVAVIFVLFQFYLTKLRDELNDSCDEYIHFVDRCLQIFTKLIKNICPNCY